MTNSHKGKIGQALIGLIPDYESLASDLVGKTSEDEIYAVVVQHLDSSDDEALQALYTAGWGIGATWAAKHVPVTKSDVPGLPGLLATARDTWNSIANAVARRLAKKLVSVAITGAMTATYIRDILADPVKADSIATTEVTRSMTDASLAVYQEARVQTLSFVTAGDTRVCGICNENEYAGSIQMGESFPNGYPPCHPSCRCSVVPDFTLGSLDALTTIANDFIDSEF